MTNVLIVEDSPVAQQLLAHVLGSDPALHVIGMVSSGEEALEFLARHKPDVITMDIHLPKMDGFETTRRIMETQPAPVVIVSGSFAPEEVNMTFRALEAGAVAVVEKPRGVQHPDYQTLARKLVQTVKAMAEVKVVRRWTKSRRAETGQPGVAQAAPPASPTLATSTATAAPAAKVEVVAIGVSTGGPPVLQTIFSGLPADFAAPVLVVQHITAGFLPGLAEWLNQTTNFPIQIATQGEPLLPGRAYLGPDGFHMGVERGRIVLSQEAPENGLRPAVSYLFRAVARVFGANAVGVLLTGMGRDGAEELKLMKDKGAVTIAQDKDSSVVHGMPGEAIKLDAATYVLPPPRIAVTLAMLVNRLK